ncbi:MAG: general secretion pathway protein GspG [Nitrospira sp. ST-bin4]|jgi:general secretion pathway protein G|nr:MAG: general secretion pathway protein GspG [Nitrospira sp. ST-bin4]
MRRDGGYTLLELLIVITIVGTLATLAEPLWEQSVLKAREAALRRTLFTMRDVIDQYRADRGGYPVSLRDVVKAGYLRVLPIDPLTKSSATWQEIPAEPEGGVSDVHSGSRLVGSDGTPYNHW